MKTFFRELPEPLLTYDLYDDFIRASGRLWFWLMYLQNIRIKSGVSIQTFIFCWCRMYGWERAGTSVIRHSQEAATAKLWSLRKASLPSCQVSFKNFYLQRVILLFIWIFPHALTHLNFPTCSDKKIKSFLRMPDRLIVCAMRCIFSVAQHESLNKMSVNGIAIIFAPTVLKSSRNMPAQESLLHVPKQTM